MHIGEVPELTPIPTGFSYESGTNVEGIVATLEKSSFAYNVAPIPEPRPRNLIRATDIFVPFDQFDQVLAFLGCHFDLTYDADDNYAAEAFYLRTDKVDPDYLTGIFELKEGMFIERTSIINANPAHSARAGQFLKDYWKRKS